MTTSRSALLLCLAATPVAAQSLGEAPRFVADETRAQAQAVAVGSVPPPDRASVVRRYHTLFLPSEVTASGWAGNVSNCTQGSTSTAFRESVRNRISAYRHFAGLPGVGLFSGTGTEATNTQRAALMMSANSALNHSPPSSWKCYTSGGRDGAYYSNLALGAYGYDAIDLYMDDPGSGNGAVGHRRWLLFPPQANVATGDIPGGSQTAANALWVSGPHGARPASHDGIVTWPPRGYVPWDALPALSNRWSLSNPVGYFVGTNVAMTGPNGALAVTKETLTSGYGDETLVWVPAGMSYTRPDGDTTYRVTLTSNSPNFGMPSPYSYSVTVIDAETLDPALAGDFNADGRSDLIWRNEATGQSSIWLMNGATFSAGATVMNNAAWRPVLLADFNGDRRTDIVWRNDTTGQSSVWLMNGTALTSGATLVTDPAWRPTHAGDFDGNGSADIVWYNAVTGRTSIWLMNGAQMASGGSVAFDGQAGWVVTHVADLDGDGRADLVARNENTGTTGLWRMNGLAVLGAAGVMADRNWRATHTADLNGDGKADLVWRNDATGATAAWLMNGTAILAGATLLTSKDWRAVQVGDFDGDGKSDLVWRNRATGQTSIWIMNGLALASGGAVLTNVDWQPAAVGNFNGDAGASGKPKHDLLWRNSKGGQHAVWLMNGAAMTSGAVVLTGAQWWAGP
jgi:hypothetical protein